MKARGSSKLVVWTLGGALAALGCVARPPTAGVVASPTDEPREATPPEEIGPSPPRENEPARPTYSEELARRFALMANDREASLEALMPSTPTPPELPAAYRLTIRQTGGLMGGTHTTVVSANGSVEETVSSVGTPRKTFRGTVDRKLVARLARFVTLQVEAVARARAGKHETDGATAFSATDLARLQVDVQSGGGVERLHREAQAEEEREATDAIAFATRQVVMEAKQPR